PISLRFFSKNTSPERVSYARETLDIYSPLANRLGVWQLKWELEDLSFRYLEPEVYKRIAQMLDERRVERQQYIARTIATLARELEEVGVKAEITGRPKHIYSIWNKMRSKSLDFSEVYDVRAARIIVPSVKDCYTDRKSTRLNSSHVSISYAVFCLKKKMKKHLISNDIQHP